MAISIQYAACTSITQEAFLVSFFGDNIFTQVTHDPDIVKRWISDIESIHRNRLHSLIVGLDVEWRPSFNRHQQNPVATLQLCVGRRCLIYQIVHSDDDIPESLVDFLSNEDYTFVGVNIGSHLDKLVTDYDKIEKVDNAVDLRRLAAGRNNRRDLLKAGLEELAKVVLRKEVEKPRGLTMSRWDSRLLTAEQVQYACIDAFMCFEIGRILKAPDYLRY
ncbi:Werner Syndrome-like exonuclease [Sesamum indicum]|uniref:Werner Syndrome-like exonuclease n=1 Tax=Sesamum indicum TaxID=4182 RepID=A0A6I9SKI6_SESIN|nr:Werner Syndrome-like exonuclease [Sesamum indicum]